MPRTVAAIQHGIDQGDHLGAQLCVWHRGALIVDFAIGQKRPGIALASDDLLPWMSAGKPLTAVAVAQLVDRGRIRFDDRVGTVIPEFAVGGKEDITIRQVLMHTGGFRLVSNNWSAEPWEQIIQRICASHIEAGWMPGERAGYHVASGWFLLGEIIQRMSGQRFDRYMRNELLEPLGMCDTWIGMPAEQFAAYGGFEGRVAEMFTTEPPSPTAPPNAKGMVNTEAGCIAFRPGANSRGPIRELARFYQMLLNGGSLDGRRVLNEAMARLLVSRQRAGMMDQTFKRVIDWGLGFIVNSRRYGDERLPYGFGPYASDDSFGHGGNQSSCGLADPQRELVVTWVCNGMPGEGDQCGGV